MIILKFCCISLVLPELNNKDKASRTWGVDMWPRNLLLSRVHVPQTDVDQIFGWHTRFDPREVGQDGNLSTSRTIWIFGPSEHKPMVPTGFNGPLRAARGAGKTWAVRGCFRWLRSAPCWCLRGRRPKRRSARRPPPSDRGWSRWPNWWRQTESWRHTSCLLCTSLSLLIHSLQERKSNSVEK